MRQVIECKHAGVYVEAMKLDGNAEQVLAWMVELGNPHGDSSVFWELDDNGPIYFLNNDGRHLASQGQYVAVCADGQFHSFSEEDFEERFEVLDMEDDGHLYDGTPGCKHNIVTLNSGVKCSKCPGWFCF